MGALAGVAAWGTASVAPAPFVVAVAFGASIGLTGAIHVDGFLDSCDALGANVAPERRLEIMKDPRHGSFALAGFAIAAAFWIAALSAIPPPLLPWALAFAGASARFASVLNAFVFPYGRAGASAAAFERRPPALVLATGALAIVVCALGAHHAVWLGFALLACAIAPILGRMAGQRLGGVLVGDVYGATIVALDIAILSGIGVLQGH